MGFKKNGQVPYWSHHLATGEGAPTSIDLALIKNLRFAYEIATLNNGTSDDSLVVLTLDSHNYLAPVVTETTTNWEKLSKTLQNRLHIRRSNSAADTEQQVNQLEKEISVILFLQEPEKPTPDTSYSPEDNGYRKSETSQAVRQEKYR